LFPFPRHACKLIAAVPHEIDIARELPQELCVFLFQSEVENADGVLHVSNGEDA
jgi:hypothetical protein